MSPVHAAEVVWNGGRGLAVYGGAAVGLTAAPPGFDGALDLHFVPGATPPVATVRYYGAAPREMTPDEREGLSRRLIAMHCAAWDAWEENSPTLAVVFPDPPPPPKGSP